MSELQTYSKYTRPKDCQKVFGFSRSSLYRWRDKQNFWSIKKVHNSAFVKTADVWAWIEAEGVDVKSL